ncbi:DUF5623 domain-containing protein [Sinorhizobium fredii]|uniref:DUF5623 domain-containing protein n=1 Tax=Rhizobium fredii TaxID=380 RepID=A0A2L0HBL5_RHIFR|nr:DUF5623 domain-containing protein [Sinorhizobium fredii]AUX78888.1 hypothetical protein NXT3_PB00229 [Sinorhizobium fredii]
MSTADIRPSTIPGIKRLAKSISGLKGVTHTMALDKAAVVAGYSNFSHALRVLRSSTAAASPTFSTFISVFWRDPKTDKHGTEIIEASLPMPLDGIIPARQYKKARGLWNFKRWASDFIYCQINPESADNAVSMACQAARTLQFMAATGLKPSSKSMPSSLEGRRIPGRDHVSSWFEPAPKRYIFADEPYAASVQKQQQERASWAKRNGWQLAKPRWAGMYFPEGGCELYLLSDPKTGMPVEPLVTALEKAAAPIVPENCKRIVPPAGEYFRSPAEIQQAKAKALKPRQERRPRGSATTVEYQMVMGSGRRPKAKMPVEKHRRVGTLLKDVLSANRHRLGVANRLGSVRSELDNWVQHEHDEKSLSDEVFFDLYYRERSEVPAEEYGIAGRALHISRLQEAQAIIAKEYPDCQPVRALAKKLDLAIKSLTTW